MKKTIKKTIIIVLIVILSFNFGGCFRDNSVDFESIDYRYDIEPLSSKFSFFNSIEDACWKTSIIGSTRFGPSSYTIRAFIIISSDEYTEIVDSYDFEPTELEFENGIDPKVTGSGSFRWKENSDFTQDVLGNGYIGKVYLDTNNGIVYISAESM